MKWNTGKPKQRNTEACGSFLTLGKWDNYPEINVFHFAENEFMNHDGNVRPMRLWMRIPEYERITHRG